MAIQSQAQKKTGQPMDSKQPDSETILKWLKKWGFPRRHIEGIKDMTSKGLSAFEERKAKVVHGDCLLILCGKRGPGKTQIATALGYAMGEDSQSARYYKAHDFLSLIRQQFDDDRQLKFQAREGLENSKRCGLLVLDEWSELAGTDWENRTMTNLIDHRYDNLLSTVIITNHSPKDAVKAVGESIWSRAEETGGIVVCDWPSYRTGGQK